MHALLMAATLWTANPAPAVPDAHPKLHTLLRLQLARTKDHAAGTPFTALVQFVAPPDKARRAALLAHGVTVEDGARGPLCVANVCGVQLTVGALPWLLDQEDVERVDGMPPHRPPLPPLQATQTIIGLDRVWMQRLQNGDRQQGRGVTFLDLDSSLDIFHPLFFRPDGGRYRWLDLDGDGVLTPDVDAVDLNNNGLADNNERLRAMGGMVDAWEHTGAALTAGAAWLYADENNNQRRDFGRDAGFDDSTPALGEALFVVDDVEDDGVIGVGDQLVRLSTSKVKGIYKADTRMAYLRGMNLIDYPDVEQLGHAAGVAGILVGGSPVFGKVVGLAPEADLLLAPNDALFERDPNSTTALLRAVDWGKDQGTNIIVHEYGVPIGYHADGTSPWERALTSLAAENIIQVTAAHNYAAAYAQTWVTLGAGETLQLPVTVQGMQGYPLNLFMGGIRWRGGATAIGVQVTLPDGTALDPSTDGQMGNHLVYGSRSASNRGTGMVSFYVFDYANNNYLPLPQGTWNVTLSNQDTVEHQVHIYLTDDSYYSIFTRFGVETNNRGSMAWPSTADNMVVVGAYAVNVEYGGDGILQLASYSGRGPRIDGATTISIVAPADPVSGSSEQDRLGQGDLDYFGGTSGALPHVAGAIALLLQQMPGLTQAMALTRMQASGTSTADSGTLPNDDWGAGLLSVPRLLTGTDAPANNPPQLRVDVPAETLTGQNARVDASATTDDHTAAAALRFSFDVGNDGSWEATLAGPVLEVPITDPVALVVRVTAEDEAGLQSERLVTLHGARPMEPPPGRDIPLLPNCAQGGGSPNVLVLVVLAWSLVRRRRSVPRGS